MTVFLTAAADQRGEVGDCRCASDRLTSWLQSQHPCVRHPPARTAPKSREQSEKGRRSRQRRYGENWWADARSSGVGKVKRISRQLLIKRALRENQLCFYPTPARQHGRTHTHTQKVRARSNASSPNLTAATRWRHHGWPTTARALLSGATRVTRRGADQRRTVDSWGRRKKAGKRKGIVATRLPGAVSAAVFWRRRLDRRTQGKDAACWRSVTKRPGMIYRRDHPAGNIKCNRRFKAAACRKTAGLVTIILHPQRTPAHYLLGAPHHCVCEREGVGVGRRNQFYSWTPPLEWICRVWLVRKAVRSFSVNVTNRWRCGFQVNDRIGSYSSGMSVMFLFAKLKDRLVLWASVACRATRSATKDPHSESSTWSIP